MSKRLFKTMVAVLAIAAAAAGPVRGQNSNVSWVLTPYGQLQTGDTVVILDKSTQCALPNNNGSSSAPSAVEFYLSTDQNSLADAPAATLKWVVERNGDNYKFRKPGTDDEYLYCLGDNNGVRVGTGSNNQFTFENGGTNTVPFLKNTGTGRYVGVYANTGDWRCYTSINSNITYNVISFYKRPMPHSVRMAAGTEDAANWSIASGDASVTGNQVLENVMSGSEVTATYNGTTKKVKSVKAVKYVAPAATVTTDPTATAGIIEVGSTTALVNAGAASGGTMMYAVTTTNEQPTDGFSSTRPTAEGRAAGTYYVWFYVKADADHSDSEIAGPVSVTVAVMYTVTWSSSNVFNSEHQNDAIVAWQSGTLTYGGITISKPTTGLSSFYPYDGDEQKARLICYGEPEDDDSFTFTAPSGMKFCKIEIINNNWAIGFDEYGDWTQPEDNKIVWSGTAASTVTLGTVFTAAQDLNSIVFKMIDAQ